MTRCVCVPEDLLDLLDRGQQALLMTLYRYADAGGTCFPSHEALAAKLKCSRQWVCRTLKQLEQLGVIKITKRSIPGRGWTSCVYSLQTAVTNGDTGGEDRCNDSRHHAVADGDRNKTQDSNTHTHSSGGGRVVNMPLPMPQAWGPSGAIVQQAMLQFPDITDQDLADHSAKFITRCKAKGYTYADFDAAWMDWLVRDRKEAQAKEKASAGPRHPSARERQLQDQRERDAANRRKATECLDRINARRAIF